MKYTTNAQQILRQELAAKQMMANAHHHIIAKAKADGYDVSFIGDEIVLTKNKDEVAK